MIRDAVVCTLDRIEKVDCTERLRQRHHRYRRLGCDSQNTAMVR
jgi:hypothetical protein